MRQPPKFIQIMSTGAGEGYSTYLYALGEDGVVYQYVGKGDDSFWKPLEGEVRKS